MQYWIVKCEESQYPYYEDNECAWDLGTRNHKEVFKAMQEGDKVLCYVSSGADSGIRAVLEVGTHSPESPNVNLICKQELYVPLTRLKMCSQKILGLNPEKYACFNNSDNLVQQGTFFASTKEQFEYICGLDENLGSLTSLIDSDYKVNSFEKQAGKQFKQFFKDFSTKIFAKNIAMLNPKDQKDHWYRGEFPLSYSENSSYAAIGSALHDLTPYVCSEYSLKIKGKNSQENKENTQEQSRSIDFWCMDKTQSFEAWLEVKKVWFSISKRAKRDFDSYCRKYIKGALGQIENIKQSDIEQISRKNVFRVALFINPAYCNAELKPDNDIESIPQTIHKQFVKAAREIAKDLGIRDNLNVLTSVLDLRDMQDWHIYEGEYLPYVLLHAIVLE